MRRKRRKSRRRNPKLRKVLPFVLLAGGAVVAFILIKKAKEKSDTQTAIAALTTPSISTVTAALPW